MSADLGPRYVTVKAIQYSITALFLISMLTSAYVLYLGQQANNVTNAAVKQIAVNTHSVCEANRTTAEDTNTIIDNLITATEGSVNGKTFIAATVKKYQSIKVPIKTCAP